MTTVDDAVDKTDEDAGAAKTETTPQQEKDKNGRAALTELLVPIRGRIMVGRILAGLSGVVSIAPYIALVKLGQVLLPALAGASIDSARVFAITRLLVAGFTVQVLLVFAALLVTHFADLKLGAILREGIIARIARAPLSWFDETSSGRVRKAVQDDTKALHTLVAHAPAEEMIAIVTPLALAVYTFVIDWRLGLLAIASLPVYLTIQGICMRGMGAKTAEMDTRLSDVSASVVEFADGIAVVKAFGRTGKAHKRYADAAEGFGRFYLNWVGPMMRGAAIGEAVVSVPVLLLLNVGIGSLLVRSGTVTPADVIAVTMIALILPGTIQTIGNTQWAYQLAGAAAVRLRDLLAIEELDASTEELTEAGEAAAASPANEGMVEFDLVTFAYGDSPDAQLALDNVSLRLEPGTVTALTGASGSGKSTLALMLARFYDPKAGRVRVGGRDVRTMTQAQLYATVSFVLQDPQLLRISIRDNVRLARPDASDEQVWRALSAACVADEIRALPRGLDTVFGDETELSGGQMQRVSIARALLADAPVLIMDEALSATDPDSEAEIQAALTALVAGRTVLAIAHRPESVYGADQVIRLTRGRITERLVGAEVTDTAVRELMEVRTGEVTR